MIDLSIISFFRDLAVVAELRVNDKEHIIYFYVDDKDEAYKLKKFFNDFTQEELFAYAEVSKALGRNVKEKARMIHELLLELGRIVDEGK